MVQIAFSSSFRRAKKKRIDSNKASADRFWNALRIFSQDPFDPRLRTHKLSGKLEGLWSFSVEYDLRVIFFFHEREKVVFVDIGTHEEVY
jgi:addiction module RelE/StbE family toxin